MLFGDGCMIWMIIFIALAIIIFVLLLLPLKVKIYYCFQKNNHHLLLTIYYARIRVIHRKLELSGDDTEELSFSVLFDFLQDVTEEKMTGIKVIIKTIFQQLKLAKDILTTMLNKITIQELNWKTHIGTGDASTTGLVTGGVWMIKGGLLGVFYELSNFDCKPNLAITPHFQQRGLFSEVDCIVTIRLGKAIYTALYIIRNANILPTSKWQIDS